MANNQPNLFLFFGENTFTLNQELKRWMTGFEEKHGGDLNINILQGKEVNPEKIQSALETAPFLAEKKMAIIKNFMSNGNAKTHEKILPLLKKVPDSTIAIFFEEKLPDKRTKLFRAFKTHGQLKNFHHLSLPQLERWIKDEAQYQKLDIQPQAIKKILEHTGADMWTIESELKKLALFCKGRVATSNDVETLVQPNLSTSVFKLTDALTQRNIRQAIQLFHILVESGETIRMIFSMFVRHFRILLLIADLKAQNFTRSEITKKMKTYDPKMHPYAIQMAMQQAGTFTLNELKKIYEKLVQFDLDSKTGKITNVGGDQRQMMLAIEQFMMEVAEKAE